MVSLQQHVFGMVDTSHNAAALLPIIRDWCKSGTIIHSDEWAAFCRVNSLPNITQYQAVNNSLHFVDSVRGMYTQNIENYWNNLKTELKERVDVIEIIWNPALRYGGRTHQ